MRVFCHHLYEYQKGLRRLILHTTKMEYLDLMVSKLEHRKIPYLVDKLSEKTVNLYFGDKTCISVLIGFCSIRPNELSIEEDFILGIMLGYDRLQQCQRYVEKKIKRKIARAS